MLNIQACPYTTTTSTSTTTTTTITTTTTTTHVLVSVYAWAFNKTFLHFRQPLATACLEFFPLIFKFSSASSLHLLRGLPSLHLFFQLQMLQFVLTFFGLARFKHDNHLSPKNCMHSTISPALICPLSPSSFLLSRFLLFLCVGPFIFLAVFRSNILSAFVSSVFEPRLLTHKSKWGLIRALYSFSLVFLHLREFGHEKFKMSAKYELRYLNLHKRFQSRVLYLKCNHRS